MPKREAVRERMFEMTYSPPCQPVVRFGGGVFEGGGGGEKYLVIMLDGILDNGGDGEVAFCVGHCLRSEKGLEDSVD